MKSSSSSSSYIHVAPTWSIGHPSNASFHSVSYLKQSVGLLGRGISPSQGGYLTQALNKHKQAQIKHKQTSMFSVGFEPTIPVFERAKMFHALDHVATVVGYHGI
jgi:hypothetical protein